MCYLLIWDIDGTLIQSRRVGKRAMDRAFLELYGIDNGFAGIDMAGRLDSMILRDAFSLHNITENNPEHFFNRYCRCLEDVIGKENHPFAVPGIPELLPALEYKGCFHNVLGTGNIERGARLKLEKDNLNRYFPTGGFGDEPLERWQVIEKAIVKAGEYFNVTYAKDRIYVIGDTQKDIECGKKLGTKTIGVAKGPYSSCELKEFGADYAFEELTDIEGFINIFK